MSIQIDEFSLAVSEILDGYAEDIQEAVAQAVEETGTKALKTVKAKSPSGPPMRRQSACSRS